ncbi:hypothetical protein ANCDUO_01595 [Ancylostoma duodenale]|uniref:G-protein coupled receptors family 1 profile domain-containing protein n=1 Tax=Ancylostoma duodenale TaxID=51022 RepID=A0A0C2H2Q7_9BILA|nr:hypothetical protein ANCDUO_01595 [Ancylostoma duodenale]
MMGITPICASVFTMIVMSIDRYWAIVHPMRRRPGKHATVAVICLIWILAVICGIPAFMASKVGLFAFKYTTERKQSVIRQGTRSPSATFSGYGQDSYRIR